MKETHLRSKKEITNEKKKIVGNIVLLTLLKFYENTCGWKGIVEIRVVLFKQRKLLFKQHNQTDP